MAAISHDRPGPLGPGQTVYTRDGHRLGKIEVVGCDAFKVAAMPDEPALWLLRDAVERTTYGGLAFLYSSLAELESWRWTPPPNPLVDETAA